MEKTREEILLNFEGLQEETDEELQNIIVEAKRIITNMELRNIEDIATANDLIFVAQFLLDERKTRAQV